MLVILGCIFLLVLTAVFFSEEIGDIIGDVMDNRHERKMQLLKIKELELKQQKATVSKESVPKDNSMLFNPDYFQEVGPHGTLCKCGNCGDTIVCKRQINEYYNSSMKVLTGLYKWHLVDGKPMCPECWKEYRKTLKKSHNSPVDDTTVKQEF